LLADSYQGEALDCLGGTLDSPSAFHTGGVYFGDNGLYYADPQGKVTRYGQDVFPNDTVLSADEKTLYAFSRGKIYAFDTAEDGTLSNQRVLATIPGGGNDGGDIDADGRIYIGGIAGVRVFESDGHYLGTIPAPFDVTGTTFSGPDKRTLFATAAIRRPGGVIATVIKIPMLAQGYLGRPR
jgi:gluconolactonase